MFGRRKLEIPSRDEALSGRDVAVPVATQHVVLHTPMQAPWPEDMARAMFGLGCFWGAEKIFWQTPGVFSTAVGYAAGHTPHPTYEEVCSGRTGHNEVVHVTFDPAAVGYQTLLRSFFEAHDPTQGMRQGNDVGTQYRSGIYTFDDAQGQAAREAAEAYGKVLARAGHGDVTTEILAAPPFYFAEDYHQQYLHKNPTGYCGLGGLGIPFDPTHEETR